MYFILQYNPNPNPVVLSLSLSFSLSLSLSLYIYIYTYTYVIVLSRREWHFTMVHSEMHMFRQTHVQADACSGMRVPMTYNDPSK